MCKAQLTVYVQTHGKHLTPTSLCRLILSAVNALETKNQIGRGKSPHVHQLAPGLDVAVTFAVGK